MIKAWQVAVLFTVFAIILVRLVAAAISRTQIVVVIGNAVSMHRVVLPLTGAFVTHNAAASIKMGVVVVVIMTINNYYATVTPLTWTVKVGWAEVDASSPIKAWYIGVAARVIPINRWVWWPPPVAIHNASVIHGHVHNALFSGFDDDIAIVLFNANVLGFFKVAGCVSAFTQSLHCIHHLVFVA